MNSKNQVLLPSKAFYNSVIPQKVFTLLEIMREIALWSLVDIPKYIDSEIATLQSKPIGYILTKADKRGLWHLANNVIRGQFQDLGWQEAHWRSLCVRALGRPDQSRQIQLTAIEALHDLKELKRAFENAMNTRAFVEVKPTKTQFFALGENLLGEKVLRIVPAAKQDIKNAADCLGVELHTAAVFHLLMAAELGMRRIAAHLKSPIYRKKNKIKIDDTTWDELIKSIKDYLQSELAQPVADRKLKKYFKEYERLANQFDLLKDDRNKVVHAQANYSELEALVIFEKVRDFMEKVANRISTK